MEDGVNGAKLPDIKLKVELHWLQCDCKQGWSLYIKLVELHGMSVLSTRSVLNEGAYPL